MKNLYTSVIFLFISIVSIAQISPAYRAMREREMQSQQALREEPSMEAINGLDFDLVYYRLELRLNPDTTKYVKGAITTYFKTGKTNFNRITFDMASALICDSVYYHGVKLAAGNVVEQVDTLRITIPNIPSMGTLDSIKVFYKGVPPSVPTWTTTGFVRTNANPLGGTVDYYIHTLSEPYSAYTWWPSKSRIAHDKADSVDIYVSSPSIHRVAANGKRMYETVSGSNRITYWKHRYPISTYQIAIAVARYNQYPTTPAIVNIGGTNMELYNLLWSNVNAPYSATALDRTADMLQVMSNRFSDYPFKDEKYGHYTFGFGGGMEHNTFSGMGPGTMDGSSDWSVIAHELGHQWFGGSVTCGSWRDIWVNEGFARYSEAVYLEGKANNGITTTPISHRAGFKSSAIAATVQTMYRSDTSTMTTIFGSSVYIYERGAMFISMLRKTLGDTKFFQALKNYQTDPDLRYKNAYTDDVKRHMEQESGLDLDEMFNDWVYRRGHGAYNNARWNNAGGQVVLYLPQTIVGGDNTHFDAPIVVRFSRTSPAQDTTIVLFDKQGVLHRVNNGVFTSSSGGNMIQVGLSFTPTTVAFDPDAETLLQGTFTKDAGLALLATRVLDFTAKKEDKNARLLWSIDRTTDYSSFEIERSTNGTDFTVLSIQTAAQNNTAGSFHYVDYDMPTGIVFYRIKTIERDGSSFYTKIASINNKSSESFIVSPNPATDHIMIGHSASTALIVNVRITDAAGKLVKTVSKQSIAAGSRFRIPMEGFASGTYYVEIEGAEYFKVTKKISLIK